MKLWLFKVSNDDPDPTQPITLRICAEVMCSRKFDALQCHGSSRQIDIEGHLMATGKLPRKYKNDPT